MVPLAVPLPPRLFTHVTWATPTSATTVPPMVRGVVVATKVGFDVGVVIVTVGAFANIVVNEMLPLFGGLLVSTAVIVIRFAPGSRVTEAVQ